MNKKVLFTFKPVEYMTNPHMYAGLVSLDLDSGKIEKILRIPAASFKTKDAFMTNFAQGLCVDGGYAYVGCWNFIVIVDLASFSIVDSFSTPEMADIHSLSIDNNHIYVVSTATECLICFDKKTLEKKWVWGPNEKIFDNKVVKLLPSLALASYKKIINKLGIREFVQTPVYRGEETRHIHKSSSQYYRHHVNNISDDGKFLYLNTKGWFDSSSSSVVQIDKSTLGASFFVRPGTFIGSHDGVFYKKRYFVTEADNNSVASVDFKGEKLERHNLSPAGFFVRGMVIADGIFYIGFTPLRNTTDDAMIVGFDPDSFNKITEIKLPEICGQGQKTAIHAIVKMKN